MTTEPTILDWTADGHPRSRLYGDIYFSPEDGLAESRAVFLQGCGLPERWAGRNRFTVGELGFGAGLNVLALLDLWRQAAPPQSRLHIFSIEAHPISASEAAMALAPWPELAELAGLLTARWPGRARGLHRVDLPEVRAVLDVAVMEVGEALEGWDGAADAWFLDGFSPALN
ncbi:MAG TPA: MnmC family methyltransferase, partial [Phenylobacterium sp.]|nr:MnmC family methyltransferase [Phenylobacterium sp.]